MTTTETAEAISGRATGVLFFSGFGTLWLFTGLSAMHRLTRTNIALVVVLFALLLFAALSLLKRASKFPRSAQDVAHDAQISRTFRRVNTIQWIAIAAVLVLVNIFHQQALIVPAIAIIVGLHLFPLARLFRYPVHYVTGALLILWSVGTVIAFPREKIASTGALGTAAILLLSSVYTLISAARTCKRLASSV
jgi:hypothetical protein